MNRPSVTHLYYGGGFTEEDIKEHCIMTQEQKWLSYVAKLREKHDLDIQKLKGENEQLQEQISTLQGQFIDQDLEITELRKERKIIIEENAAMALKLALFNDDMEKLRIQYDAELEAFKISFTNRTMTRVDALEEWLTEYRDQLKKENVYHKNTGTINAINELLDEVSTDIQ